MVVIVESGSDPPGNFFCEGESLVQGCVMVVFKFVVVAMCVCVYMCGVTFMIIMCILYVYVL